MDQQDKTTSDKNIDNELNYRRLKSLVDILQNDSATPQEFLDYALDHAIKLTESKIGYIYYYSEENQQFILNTWSKDVMKECAVANPQSCYELSKTGIWGEAVRQRKPIVINNFETANPLKKGCPKGHVQLSKFLTIPVLNNNKIVAVVGVANKSTDYNETDILQLTLLMESVWKVVSQKKAEDDLKIANDLLLEKDTIFNQFLEHSPIYVFFKDSEIRSLYLSKNYESMLGRPINELLHKNMDDLFPSEFAKKMVDDDKNIILKNSPVFLEEELNGKFYHTIKFPINFPDKPSMLAGFTLDVTEQKNAELKLRESEEKLKEAQQIAHVGYWEYDIIQNKNYWSEEVYKIFGLSEKELPITYEFFMNLVHPDDKALVQNIYTEILKYKTCFKLEFRIINKNKQIKYINERCQLYVDENNKPIRLMGIMWDITEIKQAEIAALKKAIEWQTTFDSTNDGIFLLNLDSQIVRYNKRAVEIFPQLDSGSVGKFCWQIVHNTNEPHQNCPVSASRKSKKRESMELKIGEKWFTITSDPILDINNEINGFVHTIADITNKKNAADKLKENQEYLKAILDSMNQALIILDGVDGKILDINKRMCDMYGYTYDEGLKFSIDTLSTEDKKFKNSLEWINQIKEKDTINFETMTMHKDGHYFWVDISIRYSIINFNPRIIITASDIDERKKMEMALTQSQKLESLGILAGGIAHDFNNLLSGIFGYLSLAINISQDTKVTEYLDKAMMVKDRAKDLTQQLLTFAKGGVPVKTTAKLFPLIGETVKFALSGSNVSCNFNIAEDLWSSNFDKNQIGQVFDNLIINAKQAMPLGGFIDISAKNIIINDSTDHLLNSGNYILITVKDNGIGIPQEYLNKIFDPFFTTKQTGSGLGLTTCYSIIKQHDGTIEVESTPGKGTTFKVYLPADMKQVTEETVKLNYEHIGSGTILIMDDEAMMLDLLANMLSVLGYTVDKTSDANQALIKFYDSVKHNQNYTAIFLDLTIPGSMGGVDVVNEIRKSDTNIPIFVASGYSDNPVMANPTNYGFTASISKPFVISEVTKLLSDYLKLC